MYDEDNDGYVTEKELRDSLTHMFKARNLDVKSQKVQNTINSRVETLIAAADEDSDGKLTKEEIQKACKKDPSLLIMF